MCKVFSLSYGRLLSHAHPKSIDSNKFETSLYTHSNGIGADLISTGWNNSNSEAMQLVCAFLDKNLAPFMGDLTKLFGGSCALMVECEFNEETTMHAIQLEANQNLRKMLSDGLIYAISYANSGLKSSMNNFEYLRRDMFITRIGSEILQQGKKARGFQLAKESVKKVINELMAKANLEICVHGSSSVFDKVNTELNKMWKTIGKNKNAAVQSRKIAALNISPRKHVFKIIHRANHCVESIAIPSIMSPDYGKYRLLASLMTQVYLYPEIVAKRKALETAASTEPEGVFPMYLSLIHICRCRRYAVCRSRWSPYH
eukprot:TRINITY_DN12352_c0_g1_i5.p1 TRINITY_DN12352_c0_g1~~TRINITY_DN12352_c0_g1_i5.p1  ORF type:complete len:315 (+),score=67.92 TRINITY_DN12352_c0_g1_i5:275-1219(+)